MTRRKYKQIGQFERDRIEALLRSGHSQEDIAGVLKRDAGSISREISKNRRRIRNKDGTIDGPYEAGTAGHKAYLRRKYAKYQGGKLNENKNLKNYIVERLKKGWSPDDISGRMKLGNEPFCASKSLIYEWLYSVWGQKYCKYLKSKRYNPKKRKGKKTKKSLIPNRIGIEMRPETINSNEEYGHCESDTIVSGKKTGGKESLAVTYQRKAKYISIRKISSLKPNDFNEAILNIKKTQKIYSLTLDNGIENQYYEKLNIDTYFCEPYSSWQKGGVENANGMIRRYIPKRTNISDYSEKYIQMVEDILNNKPRKSLDYKTPREVMRENNLLLFENKKSRGQKVALRG